MAEAEVQYVSYSQLDKFLQCPYSWYLQYVEKIKEQVKSKHLDYGNAVHAAMEYMFTQKMNGTPLALEEAIDIMNLNLDMYDIIWDDEEEKNSKEKEAVIHVQNLYNPKNSLTKLVEESTIIGVERNFKDVVIADATMVGKIDIELRHNTTKRLITIDWKSGKTAFDAEKLRTNLQFKTYAISEYQTYEEYPEYGLYAFTQLHKTQKVDINPENVKEATTEIERIIKKMRTGPYTPKPTLLCYWCNHGKYNLHTCKFSSSFKPKNAKAKE